MDEEKTYYVYKHTSPSGKIYIGITSKSDPSERWKPNGNGYWKNKHFQNAIKKYGWDNFEHEILFQGLSMEEACEKEIELIALYDSANPQKGYNGSLGGEANIPSEETRKKMSEIAKERLKDKHNHPFFGKHHTEESKKKMSEYQSNRSEETRQKISQSAKERYKNPENHPMYGKHISEEQIELLRNGLIKKESLPVLQYDLNGNFVNEYINSAEASKVVGVHKSSIQKCCAGIQCTSAGFIWKYKNENYDYNDNHHIIECTQKPVCQFDADGNFLKEYRSVSEATRATGATSIGDCCHRRVKTSGGFIWRFKGDCDDVVPVIPGRHRLAKIVYQFDKQGNFVAEFSSGHEADRALGLQRGSVGQCCRGICKTAGGFKWRYKDEYNQEMQSLTSETQQND